MFKSLRRSNSANNDNKPQIREQKGQNVPVSNAQGSKPFRWIPSWSSFTSRVEEQKRKYKESLNEKMSEEREQIKKLVVKMVVKGLSEFKIRTKRTDDKDTWKNVLDDSMLLNELLFIDEKFTTRLITVEEKLEESIKSIYYILDNKIDEKTWKYKFVTNHVFEEPITDAEKKEILNEVKTQITRTPKELFVFEIKNIIERFTNVITRDNVNKYVEYSPEFKDDKIPIWRKAEKFTPALYLAKISPVCAENMLLILLKAGANLSMRAATKGCATYPSVEKPFYKKTHCTTIGKLARKLNFVERHFMDPEPVLLVKSPSMYSCLKDLNEGVFLEKRPYLNEKPELIKDIDFNFWKVDTSQSLLKRSWRCRYLDHITKPNSSLIGCGIPGVSKYSENFQTLEIPRLGKLLLGTGAMAGLFGAPFIAAPIIGAGIIIPGALPVALCLALIIGSVKRQGKMITSGKTHSITTIDIANKQTAEALKQHHDFLLELAEKEVAATPEESEESPKTQKAGGVRKNKTKRRNV